MPPTLPEGSHRTELPGFSARHGKVRDTFYVNPEELLMVASDRTSAFDRILPTSIPDKGKVLNKISRFWFQKLGEIGIRHHLITADTDEIIDRHPALAAYRERIADRSMLVKRGEIVQVEAIVRGNITGSGWVDYLKDGKVCGIELPKGLRESEKLNPPIFTPSTKEAEKHDQNISFEYACKQVGEEIMNEIREKALEIFTFARDYAETRGIILADTKFEFAKDKDGQLMLADEVLTPDSSRFWLASTYQVGRSQPSLDKQGVRDFLTNVLKWDKELPAPELPSEIVEQTRERYLEAYIRLTGDQWGV
jgi:phosphoribosylaminoimidazole-succinocarboxamide synthase